MKKITALLILLISIFFICSCKKQDDYSAFISELRSDVLFGENDNYALHAHATKREKNYLHDGVVGDMENVVILKLNCKNQATKAATATFTLDKEYSAEFQFSALEGAYIASVKTSKLPSANLTVTITHDKTAENIELYSTLKSDTVDCKKAITAVAQKHSDLIKTLSETGSLNAEINVRLISENDDNFWYVGFVDKTQTYAFLVEGKTCKIIAEKTFKNT